MSDERRLHREVAVRQVELLANADRQVTECELIVAEWSTLIGRMRAEGREVTVSGDLLETFKDNLEARRSNHDLISKIWSSSPTTGR
jgi:hypothetical protein